MLITSPSSLFLSLNVNNERELERERHTKRVITISMYFMKLFVWDKSVIYKVKK